MLAIDTNVFVASFNTPVTDQEARQHMSASGVLSDISTGNIPAVVTEVVLHECYYVMVMRDKKLDNQTFCDLFRRVLVWPGWAMPSSELDVFNRALDYLQIEPRLEFSDAVIAARAEAYGAELATFDKDLLAVYDGPTWTID